MGDWCVSTQSEGQQQANTIPDHKAARLVSFTSKCASVIWLRAEATHANVNGYLAVFPLHSWSTIV